MQRQAQHRILEEDQLTHSIRRSMRSQLQPQWSSTHPARAATGGRGLFRFGLICWFPSGAVIKDSGDLRKNFLHPRPCFGLNRALETRVPLGAGFRDRPVFTQAQHDAAQRRFFIRHSMDSSAGCGHVSSRCGYQANSAIPSARPLKMLLNSVSLVTIKLILRNPGTGVHRRRYAPKEKQRDYHYG